MGEAYIWKARKSGRPLRYAFTPGSLYQVYIPDMTYIPDAVMYLRPREGTHRYDADQTQTSLSWAGPHPPPRPPLMGVKRTNY